MKNTNSLLILCLFLSFTIILSCSDSSTGPDIENGDGAVNASFTVSGEVEGEKGGFSEMFFQRTEDGLDFEFYIEGENFELDISTLGFLDAPAVEQRTYEIGSFDSELVGFFEYRGEENITFDTFVEGNGGTFTITSITSDRVIGTFQFTASTIVDGDTTRQVVIEDGSFNVQLIEF